MSPKVSRTIIITGISLAWVIVLFSGVGLFWRYENKAGTAAAAPRMWPRPSRIERAGDRPTLIIVAHPHCPCTRATLHELARLMSEFHGRLTAVVVFVRPDGVEKDWEKTDSWETAAAIPGVSVFRDDLGAEALLFDAHTSGQTMLYAGNGEMLFSGGITAGRGQEGASAGGSAIAAILNGVTPDTSATNVYGCPLLGEEAYCRTGKEISN